MAAAVPVAAQSNGTQPVIDLTRRHSRPRLAPNGQQLAGVIDDRYLTVDQIEQRVAVLLQAAPPDESAESRERRAIIYADGVLEDWAHTTAIAVLAQREGYRVTDEDVDLALEQLAESADAIETDAEQRVRLIGVSEAELRAEVRDALLVERFLHDQLRERYTDDNLRAIFARRPSLFLDPPAAHVWQLHRPTTMGMSRDEIEDLADELEDWRRPLSRCDDEDDFDELTEEIESETDLRLVDMGWVEADEPLPGGLLAAIASTPPGETTPVFRSEAGLHVIKVIERREGDPDDFEAARKAVENYVFAQLHEFYYAQCARELNIELAAGGLYDVIDMGPEPVEPAEATETDPQPPPIGTPIDTGRIRDDNNRR